MGGRPGPLPPVGGWEVSGQTITTTTTAATAAGVGDEGKYVVHAPTIITTITVTT